MAEQKYIPLAELPGLLDKLAKNAEVFVPKRENRAVVYRPYAAGDAVELAERPTESCKHAVFPRAEELFRFQKVKNPEAPGLERIELSEPAEPGKTVVFGALSCDARGFFAFDPVYNGCGTDGIARDTYYLKHRQNTLLVVKTCNTALSTCFCHWVGGGPVSSEGADAVFTQVADGLILWGVSEAGKALVDSLGLKDAAEAQTKAVEAAHAEVTQAMGPAPELGTSPPSLLKLFDDASFWQAQSAGCISCGACTYLCPTCYCFNITDESNGISGVRLRSWDTCMSPLFTLEASGHNPRTGKAQRLRNRVGHKFSYYPSLHGGRFSCCGCGRCIKSCPSSIDIRRIVQNAMAGGVKEAPNG